MKEVGNSDFERALVGLRPHLAGFPGAAGLADSLLARIEDQRQGGLGITLETLAHDVLQSVYYLETEIAALRDQRF